MLLDFLRHWLSSGNAYHIHSPFVYKLYTELICSQDMYYAFEDLLALREAMQNNHTLLQVQDLGAGSRTNTQQGQRKVSQIFHHSASSQRKSHLLFKLVNHFQPNYVVELGTSLGVNTLYLWSARRQMKLWTFEGCPQIAQIAKQNFMEWGADNIQLVVGNLDTTLPETLAYIPQIDFAFFDANHQYRPTMQYFEQCLRRTHEHSILVFDDIYWSAEMKQAWQEIQNHPAVRLTIDLFYVGLVFLDTKISPQHFKLYWK